MHSKIKNAIQLQATAKNLKTFDVVYQDIKETIIAAMLKKTTNKIGKVYVENAEQIHNRFRSGVNDWLLSVGIPYLSTNEISSDPFCQYISKDLELTYISLASDFVAETELKHRGIWQEIDDVT